MSSINVIQKEISDKYRVIKEINFRKDIDTSKSDRFSIDNELGCLRFLYKEDRNVKFEDYSLVNGQLVVKSEGIELISTLNDMTDNKIKRAHIITKEGISLNNIDFIKIDIDLDKQNNFFIMMNNKYSFDLLQRHKNKELFLGGEAYSSNERKVLSFMFTSYLTINTYKGMSMEPLLAKEINSKNPHSNIMINFKSNYILMEDQKIELPLFEFDRNEELYTSLILNSRSLTECDPHVTIRSMIFGMEKGYIYLRPISVEDKPAKVFMVYKGKPTLQYFSVKDSKWVDIHDNSSIDAENEILIRINMQKGDILYKLLVTEEIEK